MYNYIDNQTWIEELGELISVLKIIESGNLCNKYFNNICQSQTQVYKNKDNLYRIQNFLLFINSDYLCAYVPLEIKTT